MIRQKTNINDSTFKLTCTRDSDVMKIIKTLNPNKATGHDSFPPKLLKISGPAIVNVITCLFNRIVNNKLFPSEMKKAEVSPIFKSADKYEKTNYRPISILPSLNTVFEKLINSQLQCFSDIIFNDKICAHRKCHSTQSVILKAVEDWKSFLDKHEHVAAVSTDLSKAFDVLPHGLLLAKLKAYGFDNDTLVIFHDYLSNRSQRIKISNTRSDWCKIKKGVPQGSVLGPVLFNLFINDIFYFVNNCCMYNYADDNVISYHATSIDDLKSVLESNLLNLLDWFSSNGLKANPSKFQLISFGNTDIGSVTVGDSVIEQQSCIKYLGVLIDKKLSFSDQVNNVCTKASRQVNALMRLSNLLDQNTKLLLYNAFISANYEYCSIIWSLCNKNLLKKLCKIQHRALRFVSNNYQAEYKDLLTDSNSSCITIMFIRKIAIEMYKVAHNLLPPFVGALFNFCNSNFTLRSQNNFILKAPNTTKYGKLSFIYVGVKIWNKLPKSLKEADSLSAFKVLIKNFNFQADIWSYVNDL
jgi:hypothetical protein